MFNRFSSFATIAAACATVALTCAAQALASNGHPAKLASPVIHESFTPLPCSGSPAKRSTLQQEGCAEHQILRSDKQINALNRQIFGALHSDSARRDFVAGHQAWLIYRKRYCLSASDVFQGGTEAGVVDAECTATVNTQHISNLRTVLANLRA
jgi:uncharacterized protein YecT (DUF1311 family)